MNERLTSEQYADTLHDIAERAYTRACELAGSDTDLIDGLYDALYDRYYDEWVKGVSA